MARLCVLACALATTLFVLNARADEQEKPQADASAAETVQEGAPPKVDAAAEQVRANPDDTTALQTYLLLKLRQIATAANGNSDQVDKQIDELRTFVNSLEPTTEESKTLVGRVQSTLGLLEQQIKLARVSIDELAAKLKENPADNNTLQLYSQKAAREIYGLASDKPDEAQAKLDAVIAFLKERQEAVDDEGAKKSYEQMRERIVGTVERAIQRARDLAALVGKEAAPLDVETWANGEPLTSEDLKGKVVLLDFWAIWCGPCIATFPHLREWQEKYADKGLVIIGLTRFYQYVWDEAAGRATRGEGEVTPEQELEMLAKFAEHHELKHRFAIQKDSTLSEYYAVTGIPHVVLIDREGKIRLFRVGSGEKNANDIHAMIETLLAEGAPAAAGE